MGNPSLLRGKSSYRTGAFHPEAEIKTKRKSWSYPPRTERKRWSCSQRAVAGGPFKGPFPPADEQLQSSNITGSPR
jgi:hypothetical protein